MVKTGNGCWSSDMTMTICLTTQSKGKGKGKNQGSIFIEQVGSIRNQCFATLQPSFRGAIDYKYIVHNVDVSMFEFT